MLQYIRPAHALLKKFLHLGDNFLDGPLLAPICLHDHLHCGLEFEPVCPRKVCRRFGRKLEVFRADSSRQHAGRAAHDLFVGESRGSLHLLCHALNGCADKIDVTDALRPKGRQGRIELRDGLLRRRCLLHGLVQKTRHARKGGGPAYALQHRGKSAIDAALEIIQNGRRLLHVALQAGNVHAELHIEICNGINRHQSRSLNCMNPALILSATVSASSPFKRLFSISK